MSLQIIAIDDRAKPNMERIILEATVPLSLAFYVVLHSTALGEGVASGSHPAFWFPTVTVPAGRKIQLFTGSDLSNKPLDLSGFNYFWGLKQTIFNSASDCAVLIQAANWQSHKAEIYPAPTLGGLLGALGSAGKKV